MPATAQTTNPIVVENQKPGNPQSEWDLSGRGAYSGSGAMHFIEGFAIDLSSVAGNRSTSCSVRRSGTGETPPVADDVSGLVTTQNTALSIPASALLSHDSDPDCDMLSITSVSNPTNGTVTYNARTQTVTFTPTTGYTGPASFTYTITDGHNNFASANVSLTVNAPCKTASLFSSSDAPAIVAVKNGNSVELGVPNFCDWQHHRVPVL